MGEKRPHDVQLAQLQTLLVERQISCLSLNSIQQNLAISRKQLTSITFLARFQCPFFTEQVAYNRSALGIPSFEYVLFQSGLPQKDLPGRALCGQGLQGCGLCRFGLHGACSYWFELPDHGLCWLYQFGMACMDDPYSGHLKFNFQLIPQGLD